MSPASVFTPVDTLAASLSLSDSIADVTLTLAASNVTVMRSSVMLKYVARLARYWAALNEATSPEIVDRYVVVYLMAAPGLIGGGLGGGAEGGGTEGGGVDGGSGGVTGGL